MVDYGALKTQALILKHGVRLKAALEKAFPEIREKESLTN